MLNSESETKIFFTTNIYFFVLTNSVFNIKDKKANSTYDTKQLTIHSTILKKYVSRSYALIRVNLHKKVHTVHLNK